MGIRMLHRRTAPVRTQAQAHADKARPFVHRAVPAHASRAGTPRVPVDLETLLRRAKERAANSDLPGDLVAFFWRAASGDSFPAHLARALRQALTDTRHRLTNGTLAAVDQQDPAPGPHPWTELALAYLALVLTLLPRSRPLPTLTVFVADAVSAVPPGSAQDRRRTPAPDATP
ncbi:hypothetical protein ABZ896_40895 [Streptomyces sp. NPDC047072]|uniref:hypothetical protein n=1 Tax=Streptomyces sp. NPDC047072 TaxID=3154809 RepID=UPI0034014267